jgi:FkbM family methyltransferase
MSFRRLAERMSRGVVLCRRLPAKFGRLHVYVTPEAGLRYWLAMSRVDPTLYRMVEELVRPGATVWDVGANVGLFSFCAAALSGPSGFVLSVEPDLWLAQLVGRSARELSLRRSKCSCVRVVCASVSDSNRVTELNVSERARSSNHLIHASGSTQAQGSRYIQQTVSLTLDFLLEHYPPPSVLKIDVETHEANVLQGATRLLREVRPTVWCEVSHENSDEVTRLLHDAGYQLYGAATQPHMRTERAWFDTLGIPIESCVS